MRKILTFTLVGFFAQLIDGSLGMAYGATSATFLIASGYSPVVASASIHLAEVGTTFASAVSHARFGNVDWTVVKRMALPGAVAAFVGASVLTSVDGDTIKPWTAGILLGLGVVVLLRFGVGLGRGSRRRRLSATASGGVGLVAGFVDAIGGGGWGPVATPTLLTTTRMEPRKVIGSVDTSEFLVALGASAGFLLGIGSEGIQSSVVAALLVGGLVAAPIAAWMVRVLPTDLLGVGVGGLLVVTNARTLVGEFGVDGIVVYPPLFALWAGLVCWRLAVRRREQPADQWATQAPSSSSLEATSGGRVPSSTSASVTASSTDRSEARTATQTDTSDATLPS